MMPPIFLAGFNGLDLLVVLIMVGVIVWCVAVSAVHGQEQIDEIRASILADEQQAIADDEPTIDLASDYGEVE